MNDSFPVGSKKYADAFEAYFGVIAMESGICTHYNDFNLKIWTNWKESCDFFHHYSKDNFKKLDLMYDKSSHCKIETDRYIMQVKNNYRNDLENLFNVESDDYEKQAEVERLEFLGTAALKWFFTKIFDHNMSSYNVEQLAALRNIGLRKDIVTQWATLLLEVPSYSPFYSLLNKKKRKDSTFKMKSRYIRRYLGFIVSTYIPQSVNQQNYRLFQIGWIECESFVNSIYSNYMRKRGESDLIKKKHIQLIDPALLYHNKSFKKGLIDGMSKKKKLKF